LKIIRRLAVCLVVCVPVVAQPAPAAPSWSWSANLDLRANYRNSQSARFELKFPFSPVMLPPGETHGYEQTVDAGSHWEVSLVTLKVDVAYGDLFAARAKIDAIDLYDRNPTSGDRKADMDELWIRFGQKPDGLNLPQGTTFFVQVGKAPKFDRQPVLLLESYGLVNTAFNRMEDTQFLLGGTIGRNLYWRAQYSNGNPVFFRDSNALAGDNGVDVLLTPNPDPRLKSGFPILYDAEVEKLWFPSSTDTMERGVGLGYRWLSADFSKGFDILTYRYRRDLADKASLYGTFYGGDLKLFHGVDPHGIATVGREKTRTGARFHGEWGGATLLAQYVEEDIAGLRRDGYEVEAGWRIPLAVGPDLGGAPLLTSVQPAIRYSVLDNHFRGAETYPAPSVWWDWVKTDVGVRAGLGDYLELTLEHSFHDVRIPTKLDLDETLLTMRVKLKS